MHERGLVPLDRCSRRRDVPPVSRHLSWHWQPGCLISGGQRPKAGWQRSSSLISSPATSIAAHRCFRNGWFGTTGGQRGFGGRCGSWGAGGMADILLHAVRACREEPCRTKIGLSRFFRSLGIEEQIDYALRHRAVIAAYGRFPHRNAILGRVSTEAEKDYLAQPGAGF